MGSSFLDGRLTPSESAYYEILGLKIPPEFEQIARIGGPLTPEETAENAHRARQAETWLYAQRLAIIRKHGVTAEYLARAKADEQEILATITTLKARLVAIRRKIKDLSQ